MKNFTKVILLLFLVLICITGVSASDLNGDDNGLGDMGDVCSEESVYFSPSYNSHQSDNSLDLDVSNDSYNHVKKVEKENVNINSIESDSVDPDKDVEKSCLSKFLASSDLSDANVHRITQENYDEYFDEDGYLSNNNVLPYDIIDLSGEIIDRDLVFQIPLTVTSLAGDAKLLDSTVQFDKVVANDNNKVKVYNLNIENHVSGVNGVALTYSSNVEIFNNTIYTTGSSGNPIRLICSNYSYVHDNILRTSYEGFMNASWLHSCIILGDSHFNNISSNDVTVKESNGIYLSSYGMNPSNYNLIFNNTVRSSSISNKTGLPNPSSWTYGIQVMGDYNEILNNTVYNSYRGTSLDGHYNQIIGNDYFNLTGGYLEDNDGLEGSDYAIYGSYSTLIINNTIHDSNFVSAAIHVLGNSSVYGNSIDLNDDDYGIIIDHDSDNVLVFNNSITFVSGVGVTAFGSVNNLNIYGNKIISDSGTSIALKKRTSKTFPTNVTIRENFILSKNKNPVEFNDLEEYAVLYNNSINYIFLIRNETFFDYFDKNGYLKDFNESVNYIVFDGEFSNLNLSRIYVNKPCNIMGNGKVSNIQFVLSSDNISIEGMEFYSDINLPIIYGENIKNLSLNGNKFDSKSKSNVICLNDVVDASLFKNDFFSSSVVIYANGSNLNVSNNYFDIEGDYAAICLVDNAHMDAVLNKIFTDSIYAINLTNTGNSSSGGLKNNISNNHLASKISNGSAENYKEALVYYDESCEDNNVISDNFGLKTIVIVDNDFSYVNVYPMLRVILTDIDNNPIADQKIRLDLVDADNKLRNFEIITDLDGMALLEEYLPVSNYSFNLTYDGNDLYKPVQSKNNILKVKYLGTNIVISDMEIYYGNVSFKVALKGEDGSRLNAKYVQVNVGGKTYGNYTVNGEANFNIGILDVGNYSVESSFSGDSNCIKSSTMSKITVNPMSTSIAANNLAMYYKNGSGLIAYMKDFYGNPIVNKTLIISLNGKNYARTTDSSGKVSLSISLAPKTYTANIKFAGDNNFSSSSKSVTVQVLVRPTKIVASNLIKYYGDKKYFTFYLKDTNNNALASKKVSITINKKTYKKTTDKNGKVTILFNLPKKSYTALIKFSASYFKASSKKVTVKVVYPVIKASSTKVKKGKYLNVVFKTYNNKVIKNQKVYFKFKGKTFTITTNGKGIASLKCNIKKGSYKLVAGFKNVNAYGKFTKTINFRVV